MAPASSGLSAAMAPFSRGTPRGRQGAERGRVEPTDTSTILIVDDEPGITHTLGDLFADEGYRVATASDGPSAMAAAADPALPPDLVLLDVMLPGLDGLAVCRRLRAAPETRAVPVVFITAVALERLTPHLGLCPGATIVAKPFRFAELLAAVRRQLASSPPGHPREPAGGDASRGIAPPGPGGGGPSPTAHPA